MVAVYVPYNFLYISLPSSAKQQREMVKFCVFWSIKKYSTSRPNFAGCVWTEGVT